MQIHISGQLTHARFAFHVLSVLRTALSLAYIFPELPRLIAALDLLRDMTGWTVQDFHTPDADGINVNLLLLITDRNGASVNVLLCGDESVEELQLCAESFTLVGSVESELLCFRCKSAHFRMCDVVRMAQRSGDNVMITYEPRQRIVTIATYEPEPEPSVIAVAVLLA